MVAIARRSKTPPPDPIKLAQAEAAELSAELAAEIDAAPAALLLHGTDVMPNVDGLDGFVLITERIGLGGVTAIWCVRHEGAPSDVDFVYFHQPVQAERWARKWLADYWRTITPCQTTILDPGLPSPIAAILPRARKVFSQRPILS